ncbi:MAG: S8 family serine peptidase [Puia sp.]|nr:S8 family serine peptidase [Puia sp.]
MKKILVVGLNTLMCLSGEAQQANWQNLDLEKDSVFGISTEKTYLHLLKDKKPTNVIVAIIDTGIDTLHEDLRPILWTNQTDGSHGWNFIGSETGQEDVTHIAGFKNDFFDSLSYTLVPFVYRAGYEAHRKATSVLAEKIDAMKSLVKSLEFSDQIAGEIQQKIHKHNPDSVDFANYIPQGENEKKFLQIVRERLPEYKAWEDCKFCEIDNPIKLARYHLNHGLNISDEEPDTATGNADIGPDAIGMIANANLVPYHGTHVAGIIGAVRNNGKGINGIADDVQIMMLKANGNIRELRDKNLANAIIFAVDHGAKVINMSFGKPYSWDKKAVDNAVKYAMQKDVLLVHAAGNAGEDLDAVEHYPNPIYSDKSGCAEAWIEVGASGWKDDSTLAAPFTNYGQTTVNVFAPGAQIYSSIPGSKYASYTGTSMAAPVVSGLAALIREYYPQLTAIDVKNIIYSSVTKVQHKVFVRDKNGVTQLVPFANICTTGGIVNAYTALKLAEKYSLYPKCRQNE